MESVRFLSPDVALMHALGGTVMRGKSRSAPERDSIQTLVAIKRNGMAPRRISEYKGQAHEPERSEYFHLAVHGLAVESVWSKEIDGPAHLTKR